MDILYTVNEVLDYLHISRATMYRWMREGKFPKPIKVGPRVRLWKGADITEWVNSREVGIE